VTVWLGELVTNAQVKKGYVRAIAKVHPDKVKLNRFFFFRLLNFYYYYNRQFTSGKHEGRQRQ
jgi:hypothetical protein